MPTSPILDLDGVDLDAVAVSADEVGRMNPQTGDMRQLDHVILYDPDRRVGVGVKRVREDEFWVPLHIPGRPLMPGVLMIEAGAQMCSIYHKLRTKEDRFLGFTRLEQTSFRGQVVPGDTLYLVVEEVKFSVRRFVCRAQGLVDGDIRFDALITGMVL